MDRSEGAAGVSAEDVRVIQFSEEQSLASICELLHRRGIERDHEEIREAAKKQLMRHPKLNHLQGAYAALVQMLRDDPVSEFPRVFGRVK